MNKRDMLEAVLEQEYNFIAGFALSSDKRAVKELITDSLVRSFRRLDFSLTDGDMPKKLREAIERTSVYKFATVVDAATTKEDFAELLGTVFDGPVASKIRCGTWAEARHTNGVEWKFRFSYPPAQDTVGENIVRRKRKTAAAPSLPESVKLARPEVRMRDGELPDWLHNVPAAQMNIIRQLAAVRDMTLMQERIIELIMRNRLEADTLNIWSAELVLECGGGASNRYAVSVKKT